MKDDLTPEQKERLQLQDEFLQDVKNATEGDKNKLHLRTFKMKKKFTPMKPNEETKARKKNVDVNALEKVYQQNKKDLNDENIKNAVNPKYQSPRVTKKKTLQKFESNIDAMDERKKSSVRKVFGK